jgi:hypothetical protein
MEVGGIPTGIEIAALQLDSTAGSIDGVAFRHDDVGVQDRRR